MSLDSSTFLWWFASSGGGRAFRCFGLEKISKHASLALFPQAIALNLLPFTGYLTSAEAAHTPPKEQIQKEMAAVAPVSPPGCLPGGSRLFSTRPAQVRRCHLLLESALLARTGCLRR